MYLARTRQRGAWAARPSDDLPTPLSCNSEKRKERSAKKHLSPGRQHSKDHPRQTAQQSKTSNSPAYAKMEPDGDQATAVTQPPQENWW